MSPILGIIASQNYPRVTNAYESIATVTVGSGGSSSISFSSIPSGFKHLQLRMIGRSTRAANEGYGVVRFNSDTGSNYSYHSLAGNGSSAAADGSGSVAYPTLLYFPAASRGASIFGAGVLDILDYQNTNKNKTIRVLDGYDSNGAGYSTLQSGAWYNTAAITSITITEFNGNNFAEFSKFALYGIKG
jgi:hypothetical protein